MKITNSNGRSWISKFNSSGMTIHIVNAEIEEVTINNMGMVIKVKKE